MRGMRFFFDNRLNGTVKLCCASDLPSGMRRKMKPNFFLGCKKKYFINISIMVAPVLKYLSIKFVRFPGTVINRICDERMGSFLL